MSFCEVQVSLVTLGIPSAPLHGLVLWFEHKAKADAFFDSEMEAFEDRRASRVAVSVHFKDDELASRGHHLGLMVYAGDVQFAVEVEHVDRAIIGGLTATLSKYPYTLVVAGYVGNDGARHLVPDSLYSTSELWLNDKLIRGTKLFPFPYTELKTALSSVNIES
jgi:hypothetical protein